MSFALFQFEITVLKISCLLKCKEYYIRSDFADVFSIYLKNPKLKINNKNQTQGKKKNKNKYLNDERGDCVYSPHPQIVEFISTTEQLRQKMKLHPLVLTILTKKQEKIDTGTIHIPWNDSFYDFLDGTTSTIPQRITDKAKYHLYSNDRSKRMAVITLQIKLSHCNDNCECRSVYSDSNVSTYVGKNDILNHGTIKTRYRGKTVDAYNKKIKAKRESVSDLSQGDKQLTPCDNSENMKGSLSDFTSIKQLQDELCNYFINNDNDAFPKQVFCVGYCAVEHDKPPPSTTSSKTSNKVTSSPSSENGQPVEKYKLNLCDDECPQANNTHSLCALDLPEKARSMIVITECHDVNCDNKEKDVVSPISSKILIDLHNLGRDCCKPEVKIEEINVDMKTNVKFEDHTCDCACECTFGFIRKTTYCTVCRGYEVKGSDLAGQLLHELPHPCPLYHNLMDKYKSKSLILSTSGSGSKRTLKSGKSSGKSSGKTLSGNSKEFLTSKSDLIQKKSNMVFDKKSLGDVSKKSADVEAEKAKKIDKDARFKFKHGYQGIPRIIGKEEIKPTGVPKRMGWLWNAEDIPGMKSRPNWKPGATHKHVVKLLKIAKNPDVIISKKKRRRDANKKKNAKRPLLTVHKKDGEYNVTMETVKLMQKPRTVNQFPYEDKPPFTFVIGRTEEENYQRQKRRERAQRNLEREKRQFIESSFKNVCKEICLKTYQQALGILPGTEDPDCPCFPTIQDKDDSDMERECSCSDDKRSLESETDSDEWIVNFTPPNAKFDPNMKVKRVIKVDSATQYTYLDYKVKLLDRLGYPVPRFFKGPDGKEQCSDLGGFWDPDKKWLEINVDGYIAPDGRWAPNSFIGPEGDQIDTDTGKFQCTNGNWLMVGVDGYINADGKWQYYRRTTLRLGKDRSRSIGCGSPKKNIGSGDVKDKNIKVPQPPVHDVKKGSGSKTKSSVWSCFAENISPKYLSEMGIVGHGHDRVLLKKSLTEMAARGEKVKIPQPSTVPKLLRRNVMKVHKSRSYFVEKPRCHHPLPSEKGVIAVDEDGNKVYFRIKSYKNKRNFGRAHALKEQGISLSSFHVPCLTSFVNTEMMKQQLRDRLFTLAAKLNSNQEY